MRARTAHALRPQQSHRAATSAVGRVDSPVSRHVAALADTLLGESADGGLGSDDRRGRAVGVLDRLPRHDGQGAVLGDRCAVHLNQAHTPGYGAYLALSTMDRYHDPNGGLESGLALLRRCIGEVQKRLVVNLCVAARSPSAEDAGASSKFEWSTRPACERSSCSPMPRPARPRRPLRPRHCRLCP